MGCYIFCCQLVIAVHPTDDHVGQTWAATFSVVNELVASIECFLVQWVWLWAATVSIDNYLAVTKTTILLLTYFIHLTQFL